MAGSGKTTFLQRINSHFHQHHIPSYLINLDPAVLQLPYSPNIDIRDTVSDGAGRGAVQAPRRAAGLCLSPLQLLRTLRQRDVRPPPPAPRRHHAPQVNYKNVMKQYSLGPNGAILTSLNLFATRFDQVVALCERPRDPPLRYIVVDTPGQIEIFTWSASGAIITEAFASAFPTMIAYVIDTPRCASPQTFMTNMLQVREGEGG